MAAESSAVVTKRWHRRCAVSQRSPIRRIDDLDAGIVEMLHIVRCQRGAASERYAGDHAIPEVARLAPTLPRTHQDGRLLGGCGFEECDAALQLLSDEPGDPFFARQFSTAVRHDFKSE